jgi:pimeloyl-ACP methyl ester carboxylesterase
VTVPERADPAKLSVPTRDGRSVDVRVNGPEDAMPLVFHHGTPMSAVAFGPFVDAAADRGLRLVTYSRPGYGSSTRHEGRSVADCAADVAAIVDKLGADRFFTAGWSGGGPPALATAALLTDRVIVAATIAGVGPADAPDLDFMDGMAPENVEEFGLATHDRAALTAFVEREATAMLEATPEELADVLGGLIPPVDRAVLTGDFAAFFSESDREAFLTGIWGWYDDDLAFVRDWAFDPGAIRAPVHVWQGALDTMVPFAHGTWLAGRLATARAHLFDGDGHLSITIGRFAQILDALLESS